jgi:ADP-ribosylglycohydrolase
MHRRSTQTRIEASMWGLASGDLNGGPIRMVLRLGRSLVEKQRFDADDVFSRYRDWWRNGAFDTGAVFAKVMILVDQGHSRHEAVELANLNFEGRTGGVNPAHRVAPLACALFIPDDELPVIARKEAALTHDNQLAGDASAVTAVLLRALIRGRDWPIATQLAMKHAQCKRTRESLNIGDLPIPETGFAPDVLANALHFVERARNFESALGVALEFAGPSNYSPVLVGAMAGARFGRSPGRPKHCGSSLNADLEDLVHGLQSSIPFHPQPKPAKGFR